MSNASIPLKESQNAPIGVEVLQTMQKNGDLKITECQQDLSDPSRFSKLTLTAAQKVQLNALLQQAPLVMAAGAMSQAYTVHFPKGLPHTLTALNQGGFGSMVRGADGRIAGHASFFPMEAQAALLGMFTAMSVATGQYFLAQINSSMKEMNQKLDDILAFLYGDKKAELLSELSFAKYACQNYSSIMLHEQQQTATIASLQQSKKIAMKDLEFYLKDLDAAISKGNSDTFEKVFNCKKCLDLSLQLYVMSSLLEVYYAQNFDASYLRYLEEEVLNFIDRCNGHLQSSFGGLRVQLKIEKEKKWNALNKQAQEKFDQRIQETVQIIDDLSSGRKSVLHKAVQSSLHEPALLKNLYIKPDGVYIENLKGGAPC